jgi:hypothetical protein
VQVKHVAGKPVSIARVNTTRGTRVIGIPHIKLDSSGIVPGATVAARCRRGASVEWYPDARVYELRRFATEQASATSWADWLVLKTDDLFMSRPHGFAAAWTLERGRDGAGNPLRYGVWTDASTYDRRPYGGV